MSSAAGLNSFNEQWRASPMYREILAKVGVDPSRPFKLSDSQRKSVAFELQRRGVQIPKGVNVDAAGNLNEKEGFGKQLKKWGPIAGAAAATLFGIPGTAFHGLLSGGAAGGSAAGGAASGLGGAAFDALPNIATAAGAANAAGIGGLGLAEGLAGLGSLAPLASSSIPTSLGMAAKPGAIASQGASKGVPLLGGMTEEAARRMKNANGGGGDGGGVGDALKSMFSNPSDLAALAALIPALMGNSQQEKDAEQARRINAITEARMRRADPLHQVAVNLAFGRMPTNYRQGVNLQNVPLPE